MLLDDDVAIRTVVSQGCRPIGQPFTVTKSNRNVVTELAGKSAISRLQEVAASLPEDEQMLMRHGLHMGVVVDEHRADFGRGDFLVRSLLGADEKTGGLAVGEFVEVGQTVQFQVRDAKAADEDLRVMLRNVSGEGALLFTCNGRGTHLFGKADHDAGVVEERLGPCPSPARSAPARSAPSAAATSSTVSPPASSSSAPPRSSSDRVAPPWEWAQSPGAAGLT